MNSTLSTLLCAGLLTAAAASQSPTSRPAGSRLADQLARHFLERDRIAPPQVRSGEALGFGAGRLALLARRADGGFDVLELERRSTGAPMPPEAVQPVEIEEGVAKPPKNEQKEEETEEEEVVKEETVVEEEFVEVEVEEAPQGGEAPRPGAQPKDSAHRVAPMMGRPLRLRLSTSGDGTVAQLGERRFDTGATPDFDAIHRALESSTPRLVEVHAKADVKFGAILSAMAAIYEAGHQIQFGGGSGIPPMSDEVRRTIRALPDTLDWEANERGFYDGEVLLLFDRDQPWSAIEPIIQDLAKVGVWRLAFVGTDGKRSRFKVPAPIPVDPGLSKFKRMK